MTIKANWLQSGDIIKHEPRGHFYIVLFRTLIKKDGGGWLPGVAYRQVRPVVEGQFEPISDAEVYTRADENFDEDWSQLVKAK